MYKVVEIDHTMTRTLFISALENQCWDFIKRQRKSKASELFVVNKIGEFMEPPDDVRALRNYYRLVG